MKSGYAAAYPLFINRSRRDQKIFAQLVLGLSCQAFLWKI